jgi:quinol monooxygenase YgiN
LIFIAARFRVRPEDAARWPDTTRPITEATRGEPGCLRYDSSELGELRVER